MLNRRAVALCLIVALTYLPLLAQQSDQDLLERMRKTGVGGRPNRVDFL